MIYKKEIQLFLLKVIGFKLNNFSKASLIILMQQMVLELELLVLMHSYSFEKVYLLNIRFTFRQLEKMLMAIVERCSTRMQEDWCLEQENSYNVDLLSVMFQKERMHGKSLLIDWCLKTMRNVTVPLSKKLKTDKN